MGVVCISFRDMKKVPGLRDLQRTKEELSLALVMLDTMLETEEEDKLELRKKVESLQISNTDLQGQNQQMNKRFQQVKEDKEKLNNDVEDLRIMSNKLQIDIGKVNEEKSLLTSIVRNTQGENEMLSKLMEKISTDYADLKKAFDSQKCPKDDKIAALRSTARALETENSLLLEEKGMIAKEQTKNQSGMERKVLESQHECKKKDDQLTVYKEENNQLSARIKLLEQEIKEKPENKDKEKSSSRFGRFGSGSKTKK